MSRIRIDLLAIALCYLFISPTQAASADERARAPTVVLVHGAFADASSWNGVIPKLQAEGYEVIAVANPLRSLAGDSAYVSALLKTIPGPVILVGHSYGGSVISNAALGHYNVKALVYVAGFALEAGESTFGMSAKFPGAKLGAALAPPVALAGGGKDLYIKQSEFRAPFAADLSSAQAKLAAATQRPLTGPPATSHRASRRGRHCRTGPSTEVQTWPFRRQQWLSWQSAPGPGASRS
jgi:pimeloyl-ACP methyl ester carboxylesterase